MGPNIKTKKEIENESGVDFIRNGVLYDTKCQDPSRPSIPEFFKGRDVFITGGTGFMGRVLVEKLTRSCPGINQIFLLMREKKGNGIIERLEMLKNLPLFSVIQKQCPKLLNKLVPINGDVTQLKLGISKDDYKKMDNVSVIFHAAASVRFDDPLKYAIILNTRGTREVMRFAETLRDLKVIMHVSTTYSNIKSKVVKEAIYPSLADWKTTIKMAEELDPYIFDILAQKFMSYMPNTYTFSKQLGEQVVSYYSKKLPLVLFRPSIVISTMKDPIAGWIDNFNGPVGLLIGCGLGLTRTMYCNPDNIADFTPVDVAIKAMIVGAWFKGIKGPTSETLPVYNCSTSTIRKMTMTDIIVTAENLGKDMPIEKMIWAPGGSISTNKFANFIKAIFLHVLPAILLDSALKFSGGRTFVLGLQRKVYDANRALTYFILNNWTFKNEKFLSLDNEIKVEDSHDFHYTDFVQFDITTYFKNCVRGAKEYLLKESEANLPQARAKYIRLSRLNLAIKYILYLLLVYFCFIKNDIVTVLLNSLSFIFEIIKFW